MTVMCVYLGFLTGVPHKGEGIEGHLLYVANAAEHFFVVRYRKKTFWINIAA